MLQAVLFDLDETLLDRSRSLHAFLEAQYQRFLPHLKHVSLESYRKRFLELDNRGYVHKKNVYEQLIEEFNVQSMAWETLFEDYYARCYEYAQPFEDMRETLVALRARGLKLGIVTNGETEFQQRHLDALGLPGLVDTIIVSQTEGLRKPDARIFELAVSRLGVAAENCLFVGDHPRNDIDGAREVGMRTVWVPNGAVWMEEVGEADWEIEAIPEVVRIVEALG